MIQPLVSLGVPVRNGGEMLRAALAAIEAQDYPNIEVIISDNCSSDETFVIAAEFGRRHPNARIIRQEEPLTAFENFMWLIDQAKGDFFCWCAHDDLRSPDFVSGLLHGFDGNDNAHLCFGDLEIMDSHGVDGSACAYDFANQGLSSVSRLRKQALMQCFHIYGLWRMESLRQLPKIYCSWWPDLPFMMAAAYSGIFIHVPGPRFIYLEAPKSDAERAAYQDYVLQARSRLRNVFDLIVACFRAVRDVAGVPLALAAGVLVVEKQIRGLGVWVSRKMSKGMRDREGMAR
mgnify:CR=1 FL=1